MTIDDQVYINKILNGDSNAFAVLVDRYKGLVYTLAMRMVKNKEEAEEVVCEIQGRIWHRAKSPRLHRQSSDTTTRRKA